MIIQGNIDGKRVSSRDLEAQLQKAVRDGARELAVQADGQHGIGGRIWPQFGRVKVSIEGTAGQRIGSMGMDGTEIVVNGSTSDDTGWLNCGAVITVLGDVANGAHNAAAQGKLYVQGGGGARCDTMTKKNPRFPDLESWYFRGVGNLTALSCPSGMTHFNMEFHYMWDKDLAPVPDCNFGSAVPQWLVIRGPDLKCIGRK